MNICFISHTGDLGGSERSLLYLLESIKKEGGTKMFVVIPSSGPLAEYLKKINIRYFIHPFNWWTVRRHEKRKSLKEYFPEHLENALNLKRKLQRISPDLIVTNTSVVCEGALAANMLGIPHVWYVRELGEKDHGFIFEFGFSFTAKFINDFSTKVIFNSKAVMNEFSKYVNPDKSIVIYNSISIKKELLSVTLNVKFNNYRSFKLLVAGTISRKKNQLDVIRATIDLIQDGYDVELLLIGNCSDDLLMQRILSLIGKSSQSNRFQIHCFIENPYPLFAKSDAIIVCSKNEAFGRTILEGMLLNKPVIATNSGGVPEIITHNQNGLLYKPGKYKELANQIKNLIDNPILCKQLAKNGYETAINKFSNKNYTYKLLRIFEEQKSFVVPSKKWKRRLCISAIIKDKQSGLLFN